MQHISIFQSYKKNQSNIPYYGNHFHILLENCKFSETNMKPNSTAKGLFRFEYNGTRSKYIQKMLIISHKESLKND